MSNDIIVTKIELAVDVHIWNKTWHETHSDEIKKKLQRDPCWLQLQQVCSEDFLDDRLLESMDFLDE